MRYLLPALLTFAVPCVAQDGAAPMTCSGTDPSWSMTLLPASSTTGSMASAQTAHFDHLYEVELDFAWETRAEGVDWPRAYTFVGRGSSAILLIEDTNESNALPARVFTQRGETPVLLVGICNLIHN